MLPRRTVEELLALYALEESARDVFVEGPSDVAIVRAVIRDIDVGIYPIDVIEVSTGEVFRYGFPDNNRGRVVALGRMLEDRAGVDLSSRVVCVVDADYDYLHDVAPDHGSLVLRTDHANMPLYGLDESTFRRLLNQGMTLRSDPAEILERVANVVTETFLVRAACDRLGIPVAPIPVAKVCTGIGANFKFDRAEYVKRCLLKCSRLDNQPDLLRVIDELRPRVAARRHANSHDVLEFLAWYLRVSASRSVTIDVLDMLWRTAFDVEELRRTPMFSTLRARLSLS